MFLCFLDTGYFLFCVEINCSATARVLSCGLIATKKEFSATLLENGKLIINRLNFGWMRRVPCDTIARQREYK